MGIATSRVDIVGGDGNDTIALRSRRDNIFLDGRGGSDTYRIAGVSGPVYVRDSGSSVDVTPEDVAAFVFVTSETAGGNDLRSVYATDVDGDGDNDVLSASGLDDQIAWYENLDGQATFGAQQIISLETDEPSSVFATDVDGYGDVDREVPSASRGGMAWYDYRRAGDADRDGEVQFSDFAPRASNYGRNDATWEDGDFDLDGVVNFSDFVLLAINFGNSRQQLPFSDNVDRLVFVEGDTGATDSGSAITIDGEVVVEYDGIEEVILLPARGDFDADGNIHAADIDLLFAAIAEGSQDSRFDLNDDQRIESEDVTVLVRETLNTQFGDADLNGTVDLADFASLAEHFGQNNQGWADGDFDGDGVVQFSALSS